jgi:hypothetical protein
MSGMIDIRDRAVAAKLREIAKKVRYMPPPSNSDPEAFHIDRDEQAHAIELLAQEIWPQMVSPSRRRALPNTNGMARSPRRS